MWRVDLVNVVVGRCWMRVCVVKAVAVPTIVARITVVFMVNGWMDGWMDYYSIYMCVYVWSIHWFPFQLASSRR